MLPGLPLATRQGLQPARQVIPATTASTTTALSGGIVNAAIAVGAIGRVVSSTATAAPVIARAVIRATPAAHMANRVIRTTATTATHITGPVVGAAPATDVASGVVGAAATATIVKSASLAAISHTTIIAYPVIGTTTAAHVSGCIVATTTLAHMVRPIIRTAPRLHRRAQHHPGAHNREGCRCQANPLFHCHYSVMSSSSPEPADNGAARALFPRRRKFFQSPVQPRAINAFSRAARIGSLACKRA